MRQMKAAVWDGGAQVRLVQKEVPVIEHPHEAIVKVSMAAICSSDLHILHGAVPEAKRGVTLGHEMVGTIVHQLTRDLSEEQIREAGFDTYFVDHTTGVFPQFASGYPWSASTMQVTGDTIADLTEDLAAEQKARVTYDNILRISDDPDVSDVIKFLRAREIVHFQRFGEGLRLAKDRLDEKNVYYVNPSFDR